MTEPTVGDFDRIIAHADACIVERQGGEKTPPWSSEDRAAWERVDGLLSWDSAGSFRALRDELGQLRETAIKHRMTEVTRRTSDGGWAVETRDHGTLTFPPSAGHIASAVARIEAEGGAVAAEVAG